MKRANGGRRTAKRGVLNLGMPVVSVLGAVNRGWQGLWRGKNEVVSRKSRVEKVRRGYQAHALKIVGKAKHEIRNGGSEECCGQEGDFEKGSGDGDMLTKVKFMFTEIATVTKG